MKKSVLVKVMLLLMVSVLLLCACGNNDARDATSNSDASKIAGENSQTSEKANDSDTKSALIMGLDDTFAPMGFRDEKGELVGFDIDLANEVSKRIKREIRFQPIDWSMKENELEAGNIDLIWNGYTITPAREEKVAFSTPYLENQQIIVTMNENIKSKADLKDKVVSVQAESSALEAVNKEQDVVTTFKELVEFPTNIEAFNDLEAGRTDALVVDEVNARYYMKNQSEKEYYVLDDHFGTEEYAIGMRKDDTQLIESINNALADMENDGTYDLIYSTWFSNN